MKRDVMNRMLIEKLFNVKCIDENGLPTGSEIARTLIYIFNDKNIYYLKGIENIYAKIYSIPFEIRYNRSNWIKNSYYKTNLMERIRLTLYNNYEKFGLIENDLQRYETTKLFKLFVKEYGLIYNKETRNNFISNHFNEIVEYIDNSLLKGNKDKIKEMLRKIYNKNLIEI